MFSVSAEDLVAVLALQGVSVRTISILPWIYRLREAKFDLSALELHEPPSVGLVSIPIDRAVEILENRSYSFKGALTARGIDHLDAHVRDLMANRPAVGCAMSKALGFDLRRWRPKLGLEQLVAALVVVVAKIGREFANLTDRHGHFYEYVATQLGVSKGEAVTLVDRAGLCPKTGEVA